MPAGRRSLLGYRDRVYAAERTVKINIPCIPWTGPLKHGPVHDGRDHILNMS